MRKRTATAPPHAGNRRIPHLSPASSAIARVARLLDSLLPIMTTTCAVQPRILIADDQHDLLDALRLLLKGEGIAMEAVTSPEAVIDAVASAAPTICC